MHAGWLSEAVLQARMLLFILRLHVTAIAASCTRLLVLQATRWHEEYGTGSTSKRVAPALLRRCREERRVQA